MANKTFTFPDGGNIYAEYSGSGNNTVIFTADENTGDDKELTLTFKIASNGEIVQRKVIQEGSSPYIFELSAITSSNINVGVQLGWQYANGTNVAQPFNLNGELYNANTTNYWTNSTTEHTYNIIAERSVGKEYVFSANISANYVSITSATIESTLPTVNLSRCFSYCYNFRSFEAGNLNVTNLCQTFYQCYDLTSLEPLVNWNTQAVTTLYNTFYSCSNLTNLDSLANWNVAKVTNMVNTFYNYHDVTTHGINNWMGASANCYYMFRYCNNLDDIEIHFNITCAAYMFANRNTPLNVYPSTSTNAYNAIYRAMGN